MRTNPTHTIPSLSGTFGIPARLAHNPKMPKEPSSPSRSNTETERCNKMIINTLMNKGQLVTSCIVHLADSANIKGVTPNKRCSGLTGLCFESPNDTIHVTVRANKKMNTTDNILYKSEAYLNIKRQKIFLNSVSIYEGNYYELLKSFEKHKRIDLASLLDTKGGRKKLHVLQDQISRYLHNYLASTFSLIRASSVYYNDYFKPKNQITEYDIKIRDEINNKPVKKFIDDLRIYTQHKEIPNITTSTVYEPSPSLDYETYVKFQVEDLMSFNKWSPLSKKYIKENAKSLIIPKAINDFHEIFSSFTSWFIQQTNKCLSADKNEVEKLKLKVKQEKLKVLIRLFFKFPNVDITSFERNFTFHFNRGERLVIVREKDQMRRAEKILKMIKKYADISEEFVKNVYKLYG